ncbi:putative C6 finger domain protein [Pleurostoma richardsiae]|uniref:C6 finger domain protein n=1 Tax=Pleurostoma richardsiae TaxID=41990 RepID=A0AA38RYY3_9PEZI|nr:putative C6 finger domain protein [Pleurostoma richardsiae]
MLRRSHKKSRGGCVQCKRRHVKCDEGRPICVLCRLSERDCSYASQQLSENLPSSGTSPREGSISPGDTNSQGDITVPHANPLYAASPSNLDSPGHLSAIDHQQGHDQDPTLDAAVNLNHMELVIHLAVDGDLFNLGARIEGYYESGMSLGLKTGLEAPYLLHQLLAFSARHLAFLHPERSASFLHQAVTLQTRAVSLFNAHWTEVDQSNCVAVLLFSTILGHHLLADTLAKRDSGGLEAFMTHYVQCVELHRGIHTIALTAWPLLMESWLRPILAWSSGFTSRTPKGTHCWRIKQLVETASGMTEEDKEACRQAIKYLQVGFDAALGDEEEDKEGYNRHHMLVSWTMLVPPEFTALMAAKRPEALVLLAYYALLLHYGRHLWPIGDAGAYILRIISDYLGPEWDTWLDYPRRGMAKDSR